MDRRRILIEASDGTDASLMGYTHAELRQDLGPVLRFIESLDEPAPTPSPARERWWQAAWRILNTDIFELWRTYGPKSTRRD